MASVHAGDSVSGLYQMSYRYATFATARATSTGT